MATALPYFANFIQNIAVPEQSFNMISYLRPTWTLPQLEVRYFTNAFYSQTASYRPSIRNGEALVIIFVYGPHTYCNPNEMPDLKCLKFISQNQEVPSVIAKFRNGFIYTLHLESWLECDHYLPLIDNCFLAQKMANIHKVSYPVEHNSTTEPKIWVTIFQYVNALPEVYRNPNSVKTPFQHLVYTAICDIPYLKAGLQNISSPIVWSIGNFQCLDITYKQGTDTIESVEHTYMGTVYQAFDIANFFIHSLHPLNVDFIRDYELAWLKAYLLEINEEAFTDHSAEILHIAVDLYSVLNALYWGLYALVQVESSPACANLIHFAIRKFEDYRRYREHYMIHQ